MMNRMHGLIFAYRSNPNLRELTQHRTSCSIPYGGRYRIIDFMLSNMVNAGVSDVGLIVQSSYQSLLDHVGSGKDWDLARKRGGLRVLPPFSYADRPRGGDYRGHMDALAGIRSYLEGIRQDHVVMATGALAVNLPLEEAFRHHLESGADMTAVCTHIPKSDPRTTNYFAVGKDGFVEDAFYHPNKIEGVEALDIYILSKELLMSLVDQCAAHDQPSFGQGILVGMRGKLKISPWFYDGYAARLQSVDGYFARSMELLDPAVRADLFDPARPIKTKDRSDPSTYYGPDSRSVGSLVADGCIIEGEVKNSILFRGVHIQKGAKVENCILMQGTVVRKEAVLKYAIADKNVRVNEGRILMGHETYPMAIAKNAQV